MCFRWQFLCKMWAIQLAFLSSVTCMMLLFPLALHNTSPFFTRPIQLIFPSFFNTTISFLTTEFINFTKTFIGDPKTEFDRRLTEEKWIKMWLKLALPCSEGDPWNCGKVTSRDHGLTLEQHTEQETSHPLCSAQFVPRVCQGIAEVMNHSGVGSSIITATAGFRETQRNEGNVVFCAEIINTYLISRIWGVVVCTRVCVCIYVCMYVCMYIYVRMYVCMYVCICVCMCVCLFFVCLFLFVCIIVKFHTNISSGVARYFLKSGTSKHYGRS